MEFRLATSDDDIRSCYPVMSQLRPGYDLESFVAQVRRQERGGYRILMAVEEGQIVAVAGFRRAECLSWGKYLYVDDLVTDASVRSRGFGGDVVAWLRDHAVDTGCDEMHLDSGVQRFGAHRFYVRNGMFITGHHFRMKLNEDAT